ncbi:MAG: hypothetical protein Q4D04_13445, partial [Clostridia bacterium]|nr:hypothetical protein [Clostridia bacterium]
MMNTANDKPPGIIRVGGGLYRVNADFRVWIRILALLRDMYPEAKSAADMAHNARVALEIETLAFSHILPDETISDAMRAVAEFIAGYPDPF